MTGDVIEISPATRAILIELADRTGRTAPELLDAAVAALRQTLAVVLPVSAVPGVSPTDVWEAAAQADAGKFTPHDDVFARLRGRT